MWFRSNIRLYKDSRYDKGNKEESEGILWREKKERGLSVDAIEKEIRFQELYTKYNRLVWTYLNKGIYSREDREDVAQQIWIGVWEHVDRIPEDKEHAFLYQVIQRQIHKLYYYSTRDRKTYRSMEKEESSEGEHFNLLEITDAIDQMNEYEYFELMDTVQDILTEEEFKAFLAYTQGISRQGIQKHFNISSYYTRKLFSSINKKLTKEFGSKKTIFYIEEKERLNRSEAQKKAWAEGKYDKNRHRGPMPKQQRENISKALKGKPAKNLGYHWYNNGVDQTCAKECPEGWVKGRLK